MSEQVIDETLPEWVYASRGLELTGMRRGTFYYYVEIGRIRSRAGQNKRDRMYNAADCLQVKAERKQHRSKTTYFHDWMTPTDLPAALTLDFLVYNEALIGDIKLYTAWLKKNPQIAMTVFERKDRKTCLAYIGLIPLPEPVILDIMTGQRDELSIQADEIESYDRPGEYILLANSAVCHPDKPDLLYKVLYHIMEYWKEQYPNRRISKIYAQAASPAGDVLISKFYFAPLYQFVDGQALPVKDAYVLDLARPGASKVIRHFQAELTAKQQELGISDTALSPLPALPAPATPAAIPTVTRSPRPRSPRPAPEGQAVDVPEDAIALADFAEELGMHRRSLLELVTRYDLDHIALDNPTRPREKKRYFTAEQREAVRQWRAEHK